MKHFYWKKHLKNMVQWLVAMALGFVLVNVAISFYWRSPGWMPRNTGATFAVYHPGFLLVNGYEGYGTASADAHGYLNEDLPLADSFVLVLGCSHTKGVEVSPEKKYTSLLNESLSQGDTSQLFVYNLAIDGFYYPDIVKGFSAALAEFPNPKAVVIELPSTDYMSPLLVDALNARDYAVGQEAVSLYANLSSLEKAKILLKENLPLVSLYASKQFVTEDGSTKVPFLNTYLEAPVMDNPIQETYAPLLEETLSYLRSLYAGDLIVYYHPMLEITDQGMVLAPSVSLPWFAALCEKYSITFIDSSEAFLEAYATDYTVPYGFSNTAPGTGHLNREGHAITARLLYEKLTGETP